MFTAATLIKARAQQYVPIDTGALKNSSPVSKATESGGNVITSTISYLQDYASYLHDPKPGGKMDGWQPQLPANRTPPGGGFNANAKQGWIYIGANEAQDSVNAAFKEYLGATNATYSFSSYLSKGD